LLEDLIEPEVYDAVVALNANDRTTSEAIASMFLDKYGVKGTKFLDQPSRTELAEWEMSREGPKPNLTRNRVVFNDNNLVRVARNPGGDTRQSSRQFSRRPEGIFRERVSKGRLAWTISKKYARKTALPVQTLHSLVQNFKDTKIGKALQDYYANISDMEAYQVQLATVGQHIASTWRWMDKTPGLGRNAKALNKFLLDVTYAQAHPDVEFDHELNKHLKEEDRAKHAELRRRWQNLSAKQRQIYIEARDKLKSDWREQQRLLNELATESYAEAIAEAETQAEKNKLAKERDAFAKQHAEQLRKIKGPYFPLMRFGKYIVVMESDQYRKVEEDVAAASGETRAKLQRKLDKMKAQPQHYQVHAFEYEAEAEASVKDVDTKKWNVSQQVAVDYAAKSETLSSKAFQKIGDKLSKNLDKKNANKVREMLAEMQVATQPENALLARRLQRKNVFGADENMLRAFATTVDKSAFYLARMKYSRQISRALYDLEQQAKGDFRLGNVYEEISKRHALDMEYFPSPIQNAIAKASGIYHLVSPSYWTVNATQPWFIGAPVIAARHGMGKTFSALRAGTADAFRLLQAGVQRNGAFSDLDINEDVIANPDERRMLQHMLDRGRIDINVTHDLGVMSRGGSDWLSSMTRMAMWPAHQVETVNRIATSLAAYRLARRKGLRHEAALDYADTMIVETQVDYSNVNAPRPMKHGAIPLGKLIFQFRKYQQAMAQLIVNNALKAWPKQGLDPEQQAEAAVARKTLAMMFGMQFATAGALGLPAINTVLWIWNMLLDDDDDEGDARTQMRNYLADQFGPDLGRAIAKGPLGYMLATDLTKRTGLGDVFSPLPFLRTGGNATARESVGEFAVSALGAPANMAVNAASAWDKLEDGDWLRAMETALPKGIKDIFKAARYANEGMKTYTGGKGVEAEDFDAWDLTLRAAGFSPMVESEYYEASIASGNVEQAINSRRRKIMRDYLNARREGDRDTVREMRREIQEFNREHPRYLIKPSSLLRSAKGRMRSDFERTNPVSGMATRRPNVGPVDRFSQ